MKVCLVEDDSALLQTLARRLSREHDIHVVCAITSAEEALTVCPWAECDILLSDLDLPGASGIELIRNVREQYPDVLAMAFTISEDRDSVFGALKAGAFGYVLKGASPRRLIESLRELHRGGAPMTPSIARKVIAAMQPATDEPGFEPLTPREREILAQVAQGHLYKEIADAFGLSVHTVNTHIKRIYSKLQASGRAQAIHKAREAGLLRVV